MKEKQVVFAIKFLVLISFIVPFVVISESFIFPFIVPKIVLFRTIVLLMLGLYVILLRSNFRRYIPQWGTPLTLGLLLFIGSMIISTFFGVDWYRSFWDSHERMLGTFTLFHYFLYYIIIVSVFRKKEDWLFFLRCFLVLGGVIMIIGIIQYFKQDFLLNQSGNRVASTLGNPIYHGGLGLFIFYASISTYVFDKVNSWKFVYLSLAVLGFFGVFLSGTRGTMLAFFISLFIFILAMLFFSKQKKLRQTVGGLLVGVVFIGLMLFIFRDTSFVSNIPGLGRLLSMDLFGSSGETRIMAWRIAFDSWVGRPLFGWGPNNYFYAFNELYNPSFLLHGYGETWFDNAHNAVMNTLSTQGIVGFFSYMFLFLVAPVFSLWIILKSKQKEEKLILFPIITSGFFIAHFIHNLFVFENPTSYLYFFLFIGFIDYLYRDTIKKDTDVEISKKSDVSILWIGGIMFVIMLVIYATNIQPAKANMGALDALRYLNAGEEGSVEMLKEVLVMPTPHIDDVRSDFARTYGQMLSSVSTQNVGNIEEFEIFSIFMIDELKKNISLHPKDIRIHLQTAQIYQELARVTLKVDYLLQAEKLLEDALVLSPKRQQIVYFLSIIKFRLGKSVEAIALIDKSIEEEPMVQEGWWRKAVFLHEQGHLREAQELFIKAEEMGVNFHGNGKELKQSIMSLPIVEFHTETVSE